MNTTREFDTLNYPGSSISDYENQTDMLERRGFRTGSSASRLEYDSDAAVREPNQSFRSASSASNYTHTDYDRYNDHQPESIYAPLGRPSDNDLPPPPPIMGGDKNHHPTNLPPIIMCGSSGNDSLTDEVPPPASPVSSSYSELRRATDLATHHNLYNPYNPPSHVSRKVYLN